MLDVSIWQKNKIGLRLELRAACPTPGVVITRVRHRERPRRASRDICERDDGRDGNSPVGLRPYEFPPIYMSPL